MFQQELLKWYKANARPLIFRQKKDAYSIWVSEIMAQQTRIEAMLEKYEAFVQKFPDISSLARADEDQLHKAWQGLGYYNRVKNMQKCALVCMEEYGGTLPKTKEELKKLPGIGDYTAGAIASIAYDEKVSAIDGNVIRVYSRLYNIEEDVAKPDVRKKISQLVEETLFDPISEFNQALMELGALVCIPKSPRCSQCMIQKYCLSYRDGDPSKLPVQTKKTKRKIEHKEFYVLVHENRIHLVKRPNKGLLAGLYGFDEHKPKDILASWKLEEYTHVFSHREWNMSGMLCQVKEADASFYSIDQIENEISIPSAFMPFYEQTKRILKEEKDARNQD